MAGKIVNRGTILPFGTDEDGRLQMAVPGMLKDPYDNVISMMQNYGNYDPQRGSVQNLSDQDFARPLQAAADVGLGGISTSAAMGERAAGAGGSNIGMFLGQSARTAPPNMEQALAMGEARGLTPQQIFEGTGTRDRTGIFRGHDGVPRFEISDVKSQSFPNALREGRDSQLEQVFRHPDFFAAYPEARKMPVKALPADSPYNGYFNPGGAEGEGMHMALRMGRPEDELHSTLLHELQHFVQTREGMAPGSNPGVGDIANAAPVRRLQTEYDRAALYQQKVANEAEQFLSGDAVDRNAAMDFQRRLKDAAEAKMQAFSRYQNEQHTAYNRAGGELEARTTQERAFMGVGDRSRQVPTDWAREQPTPYAERDAVRRLNYSPEEIWHPGKTLPYPLNQYPRGWVPGG